MAERRNNRCILVDGPEPSYGSGTGLWAGSELTAAVISVEGLATAQPERVADEALRLDGDANPVIIGVAYPSAKVTITTHAEGIGDPAGTGAQGAGDGVAAVPTAVTKLIASAMQAAPVSTTGDTVAASPAPSTTVFSSTGTGLAVTPADGAIGVVGVHIAALGRTYWRPYRWTAATHLVTLLIALPQAPVAGDVLYGTSLCRYARTWRSSTIGYAAEVKVVAAEPSTANGELDVLLTGFASGLSIPEESPAKPGKLAFAGVVADVTEGSFDATPVGVAKVLRTVLAGGELLIAKYGSTARTAYDGRCSVTTTSPDTVVESAEPSGISGRIRADSAVEMGVSVLHSSAPPTGITQPTWRQALEAGPVDSSGDDAVHYHALYVMGGLPGRTVVAYMPRGVLADVQKDADLGGLESVKLILRSSTEDRDPTSVPLSPYDVPLIVAQG